MPKRITIAPHIRQEELVCRYRQAKDPVERSHYQIIWLLVIADPQKKWQRSLVTALKRIYELVWGKT